MKWALIAIAIMAAAVSLGVAWIWLCSWLDYRAWLSGKVREIECCYYDAPPDHRLRQYHAARDRDAQRKGIKVV